MFWLQWNNNIRSFLSKTHLAQKLGIVLYFINITTSPYFSKLYSIHCTLVLYNNCAIYGYKSATCYSIILSKGLNTKIPKTDLLLL